MKNLVLSLVAAATVTTYSQAVEINDDLSIETILTATTNYISRGTTQTRDRGAVFGEVDAYYDDFYVGVWTANIDYEQTKGNQEIDLYAGYAKSFNNFNLNLYYVTYVYPDTDELDEYDEAMIDLSYDFDKLTVGGSYTWMPRTENDDPDLDYYEGYAKYNFDIVTAHGSVGDYEDNGDNFNVGLTKDFDIGDTTLSFDVSYAEFNADSDSGLEDERNLYATISYTF